MPPPLPRRSVWTYCFAHFIQTYQPSPKGWSGRPAHCPFRGLLGVHSRCSLHTRAVTNLTIDTYARAAMRIERNADRTRFRKPNDRLGISPCTILIYSDRSLKSGNLVISAAFRNLKFLI